MYSKEVLKHFQRPHNQGQIKNASTTGTVGNPQCGDVIKIYLKITQKNKIKKSESDIIKDVKFETLGCAAAIAVSSAFTEIIKGKDIKTIKKIKKESIIKKLGGLPKPKIHCSMLAIEAFDDAIKNYFK